ncbi:MAG: PAS domain S-box protein [Rubrobacteraceae bacterium]
MISVILRDVTEHGRRAREEVRRLREDLEGRVAERTAQLATIVSKLSASERMLRESEERFRITFDQATVGIAHVAPDGRWLRANQRLCQIVGYPREELLEKSFQDITHADDLDADLEQVNGMLSGKLETYSREKRYLRRDGRGIWVSLAVTLVRDEEGDPD